MPVKRKMGKRRRGHVPPEAWDMLFWAGTDYLGDLDPLGLPEPHFFVVDKEARARAEAEVLEAAREAWALYGSDYLRRQSEDRRDCSWALREFGEPATCQ